MRCAASASPYQQVSAFKTKEVVEAYKKLGLSPDDEVGPIGKLKVRVNARFSLQVVSFDH